MSLELHIAAQLPAGNYRLGAEIPPSTKMRHRWRDVATWIAQQHGVTLADIMGRSRRRQVSRPRQAIMAAMREMGFSYPRIGQLLGGRDHATIMHGCRVHARRALR